jgi:hypothetical protein
VLSFPLADATATSQESPSKFLNVLQRSPGFARLAEGSAPSVSYEVMGHLYTKEYYIADGIYLEWLIFCEDTS